jgi:hypothetical protein
MMMIGVGVTTMKLHNNNKATGGSRFVTKLGRNKESSLVAPDGREWHH